MKKLHCLIAAISVAALLLPSCVSKKKFYACNDYVQRLKTDSTELRNMLNRSNASISDLQNERMNLLSQKTDIENDLRILAANSRMTIADQAKRLKDLQDLLQAQRDAINGLKKRVADALVNYKAEDLSVYIKNGNVYVSLQEQLLFKSGSAVVDPKGKEALQSLAEVLRNTQDISVVIEGHTDTVPISTPKYEDNWALSVARATAIVRILTQDYGVNPDHVTAAGRGSFFPVATNTTPEGRAANRRTEIILAPNLQELFGLLGEY